MDPRTFVPDWREVVTYAAPGPQPTLLCDEPDLRVLVAGLEPGGRIPAHPERAAVYHALEGESTPPSTPSVSSLPNRIAR